MFWLMLVSLACVLDRTGQSSTAALQREIRDNGVRIHNVEQQFVQVEARVNQLEEHTRSRGQQKILQMETLEELRSEVARLRGEVEVLSHASGQGAKSIKGRVDDAQFRVLWLESRADQLERSLGMKTPAPPAMPMETENVDSSWDGTPSDGGAQAAPLPEGANAALPDVAEVPVAEPAPVSAPAEPVPVPVPAVVAVDPVTEPALDPDTLIDTAKTQIKESNYVGALTMLHRFIEAFPNHARSDEATYRRAEAAMKSGDQQQAVLYFQEVIDQFKGSPFAPWAMLRQGECFEEQGQADNAKVFFGEVVRIYPKSRAAKAARKKLGK
jgi:tol-pal system protein YbgF